MPTASPLLSRPAPTVDRTPRCDAVGVAAGVAGNADDTGGGAVWSSRGSELYLVSSGESGRAAASVLQVDLLICTHQSIWVPSDVGVRGVGNSSTVRATYVVEHVYHPLTVDQLRSARSSPSSYVGASITAGIDVPIGHSGLAGWGGLGKGVVAAHHGSGGYGCSCCSGSNGGEGRGLGNRAPDVHVFLPAWANIQFA